MKRYIDKPFYWRIDMVDGLEVKCPYCGETGIVRKEMEYFSFQCAACGKREQKDRACYRYQISEMCDYCDRHFILDIDDEKQRHFKILNVNCPYCGHPKQGTLQKIDLHCTIEYKEIKNGIEPYFGLQLRYQASFDGKIIWAYNRDHLVYLIDYIDADLRETIRTSQSYKASYCLPKFMTLGKNRDQIVKLLKRLL